MVMSRWDPFGEALSLRDAMSRLFEQAVLQPGTQPAQSGTFAPAMDVHETQDGYMVKANLAGVKPEDVKIDFHQGVVTISAETRAERQEEQGTYRLRERRHGKFARTISLPDAVDADRAAATFADGVLELRLPKAESMKPRRIQVQAGAASEGGKRAARGAGWGQWQCSEGGTGHRMLRHLSRAPCCGRDGHSAARPTSWAGRCFLLPACFAYDARQEVTSMTKMIFSIGGSSGVTWPILLRLPASAMTLAFTASIHPII